MSDERNSPADVKLTAPGVGVSYGRRCGVCHTPRPALGSKLQLVLGVRTWVAYCCAKKRPSLFDGPENATTAVTGTSVSAQKAARPCEPTHSAGG